MKVLDRLRKEIREIAGVTAYFFCGFGFILLLFKLLLLERGIAFAALPKAVLGALVTGKVVVVLEHAPFMHWCRDRAGYVNVAFRTSVHFAGTLVVVASERIVDGWRETGALGSGIAHALEAANLYHALAVSLCVGALFLGYNAHRQVQISVGKEALREAFMPRSVGREG